jgi:hypothetical protein
MQWAQYHLEQSGLLQEHLQVPSQCNPSGKVLYYFSLEGLPDSLSSKCCCSLNRSKPCVPLNCMTVVIFWVDTTLGQMKGTSSSCSKLLLVLCGWHSSFTPLKFQVKQATSFWTSCNLEFSTLWDRKVKIKILLVSTRKQKKSKHLYKPNDSGFL